jgi:hypothetical protein
MVVSNIKKPFQIFKINIWGHFYHKKLCMKCIYFACLHMHMRLPCRRSKLEIDAKLIRRSQRKTTNNKMSTKQ